MGIEDNGPGNAYQGPAEPGSQEEVYPDASEDSGTDSGTDSGASSGSGAGSEEGEDAATVARNKGLDEMPIPDNPPVDEAEETPGQ